jgi:hypothetical protein
MGKSQLVLLLMPSPQQHQWIRLVCKVHLIQEVLVQLELLLVLDLLLQVLALVLELLLLDRAVHQVVQVEEDLRLAQVGEGQQRDLHSGSAAGGGASLGKGGSCNLLALASSDT